MVIVRRVPVPRLRRAMSGGVVGGGKEAQTVDESAEATAEVQVEGMAAWTQGRVPEAGARRASELTSVEVEEALGYGDQATPLPYLPVRELTRRELLAGRLRAVGASGVAAVERAGAEQVSVAASGSVTHVGMASGGVGGWRQHAVPDKVAEAGWETWRADLAEAGVGGKPQRRELLADAPLAYGTWAPASEDRGGRGGRRRGAVEAEDELRLELVR